MANTVFDINNFAIDRVLRGVMVSAADREISRAAKYEASLEEYIAMSAKKIRETQPGYERVVDDKSQMIAIAEQSAMNKVRTLDKFNKKRNKKEKKT